MTAWWWPGVFVGLGAALGLLGTLALISLLLALVQLLLHGCSPKRAFPTCPCWCTVSAELYHQFILKPKPCCLLQTSATRPLRDELEDGGSLDTSNNSHNQCPSLGQRLRGACCTCGRRRG